MKTRFGPFTLDSETRQLLRGDAEIHLSRKAFDLLSTLLAHRPKVLDKDELHRALWPDSHVDAAGLNVLVGDVRRALGDDAKRPQFIRTVHGVGYAFCDDAAHLQKTSVPAQATTTPCWLVWGDRTFRLSDGENVIGRDPRCSIWLDAPRVSRRHASIAINLAEDTVFLSDLDSTNGTFLGRSRVGEPVALSDGADIKIGTVALKFRRWFPERAPGTRRIRQNARDLRGTTGTKGAKHTKSAQTPVATPTTGRNNKIIISRREPGNGMAVVRPLEQQPLRDPVLSSSLQPSRTRESGADDRTLVCPPTTQNPGAASSGNTTSVCTP